MTSRFRLQVIDGTNGHAIYGWQPGDRVETDLVNDLAARLITRRVGLFSTKAQVARALHEAFGEMLYELKRRV